MNWIRFEEINHYNLSFINFSRGSLLKIISLKDLSNMEGICTSIKSKSPCINFVVSNLISGVIVEKRFNSLFTCSICVLNKIKPIKAIIIAKNMLKLFSTKRT
ncbi:MAG: hypothetical protein ACKESC_01195 [Candidatus Hodgkinia cicadicola]